MNRSRAGVATVVALGWLVACAPAPVREAARSVEAGDLPGARAALEAEVARSPRSVDARVGLGEVYYRIAREALDRDRDEARYLEFLERSVGEFVTAAEIEPRDWRPHLYLGTIDAYRGKIRGTLRSINNARKLSNNAGVMCTNIAETYVYLGDIAAARNWNELGVRRGAPYGAVVFNDMLMLWHEGDLDGARERFSTIRSGYPEMIRTINMAPLPREPATFEEFAGYCCGSPACGPYLDGACRSLELEVTQRQLSEEALRRELRIEAERERRLREVYRQRKELDIEVAPD